MRRSVAATLVLGAGTLVVWACSDQGPLTEPVGQPPVSANTTGTNLVSGFTFLPPLVKQVTTTGEFNAKLLPSVEICLHGASAPATPESPECLNPTTESQGPLILPAVLDVDHYKAEWETDKDKTGTFRIFVTLPGAIQGYIDVQLASGGGAKKANGESVETVVENAGRTIPVQFHISNEGRIEGFDPDITDPDCEDCDTWTVPLQGGTFVLRGNGGSGPPLAGIQFPDGWSPIPRDLLIACNDGNFCVAGDCEGPLADGPFPPGDGPLDSEQDPTVAAEWPLFCEFKLDPPLGDDPQEYFGITDQGESPTDAGSSDVVLADLGICQVDDASDPAQDILHPFATHDELEMGRRENGTFDRTGNTNDPTFTRLATPPAFLAGCLNVSAPLVDAGPVLELPLGLGHLAAALGDVLAPKPLMASRIVLRDGGIGSTLGSLGTIFGAVEVLDIQQIQSSFGFAYSIDGVNEAFGVLGDEWNAQTSTPVDLSDAGGPFSGATLYVMNNGGQLLLALELASSTFDGSDVVDFRFDNGPMPDGMAAAGDDQQIISIFDDDGTYSVYEDAHHDGTNWGDTDEADDGFEDFTSTFLEVAKAFQPDDVSGVDFSYDPVTAGDLLGLCLVFTDDQSGAVVTVDFPVGCSTGSAAFLLIELIPAPPIF